MDYRFIAFDLGAESGRSILGGLTHQRFEFEEIHRFPSKNITILGVQQWDVAAIYEEILAGIRACVKRQGGRFDGIAIDTWGVDFGLLSPDGTLLGHPVHYRDKRTEGMPEAAFSIIPQREVYQRTGLGFNRFNTLFQLLGLARTHPSLLGAADDFLMMADLFHYFLSGRISHEYTNASTTQLIDPVRRTWDDEMIRTYGFPRHIFKETFPAGTVIGSVLPEIAEETGLRGEIPIITPATHDTASVIAATPLVEAGDDWAYISCGTWSILGTELDRPLITDESYAMEFSNEGGAEGKICFHKTFIGLWLVQQCRRIWQRQGIQVDYGPLTEEAAAVEPFLSVIDVDDPRLYAPDDMTQAIAQICRETDQPVPESRGAFVRCALESIALKYRKTVRELDKVLGRKTRRIHLMGGGVHNRLLCQLTADACGVPVLAGPVEAAILGNLAIQARAVGALGSLAEARKVIAQSCAIRRYEPARTHLWEEFEAAFNSRCSLSRL